VRGKSERIESIHFAESSVVERQKEKFCYPSLIFRKEETLIILFSA
jgi:hypothetical protein